MSFKERISQMGETQWSIDLATHLNTAISNVTTPPVLAIKAGRVPSVVEKGFDASPDEQFLL